MLNEAPKPKEKVIEDDIEIDEPAQKKKNDNHSNMNSDITSMKVNINIVKMAMEQE
jgi:hypothetical protein